MHYLYPKAGGIASGAPVRQLISTLQPIGGFDDAPRNQLPSSYMPIIIIHKQTFSTLENTKKTQLATPYHLWQ
jgi:hypothetical protein